MSIISELLNPALEAEYTTPDFSKIGAVVAVPFNRYLRGEKPDHSNRTIAYIVKEQCTKSKLPFFGQWEQANILRANGMKEGDIHEYPSESGQWVQTQTLLRWIAVIINAYGLRNDVVLIAHPHHARRAAAIARNFGLRPAIVPECASIPYDSSDRPGAQWWCKSAIRYIPWEYGVARPALVTLMLAGKLR